jgi:hypothetical protein
VSLLYDHRMQLRLEFYDFAQVIGAMNKNNFCVDF